MDTEYTALQQVLLLITPILVVMAIFAFILWSDKHNHKIKEK